jgi:probable rRNA maturation factor
LTPPHLHINRLTEWDALAHLKERVRSAALAALSESEPVGGEISISFVSETEIQGLNRVYHGIDAPTDVLAFDLGDDPGNPDSFLGDIYICPETAREAADTEGIDWEEELLRLVIHGVLHLMGHDHPEGDDRHESEMFRLQERLLSSL